MFKPNTIRLLAIGTLLISIFALLTNLVALLSYTYFTLFSVFANLFYLFSGIFGLKLSKYDLQEAEFKSLGIRLISAISFCILSLFLISGMPSLIISVIVFGTFYSIKSNYDEWALKIKEREDNKLAKEARNMLKDSI